MRFKVKVEASLKSVELQLARRKLAGSRSGGGSPEVQGRLLHIEGRLGRLLRNETSLVSSQKASMGSVEGVDKGVDSSTVSTIRHQTGSMGSSGNSASLGLEVSSVSVESKVTVGRVMGVDEGVSVGISFFHGVIVVSKLLDGSLDRSLNGLHRGSPGGSGQRLFSLGVERSGLLTSGSDVIALNDSEAVFASGILDSEDLSVLANVGILADAVAIDVSLFSEDLSVLGGEGCSIAAVSGIESLLFQDFGIFGIDVLGQGKA